MRAIEIDIQVPKVLAVSLLHIGGQQLCVGVRNTSQRATDVSELEVRPELSVEATTVTVPRLLPGQSIELKVALSLAQWDRMRLLDLLNQQDGLACRVGVRSGGRLVAEHHVKVLPPNAWLYGEHPEALAAFVDMESDAVQRIKLAARPYLRRHLGVGSFIDAIDKPLRELSVRDEFGRMKRIATSIYECLLQSHNIHYEAEPRTYPEDWQKLRFHDQVMIERQGTCIDLALLTAACLEDAFLNPVLILFRTSPSSMHAVVGCWKTESMAPSAVTTDFHRLDAWLGGPGHERAHLLSWDVTGVSSERAWTFAQACDEGLTGLRRAGREDFVWAVDIARSREQGISPLPLGPAPALSEEGWRVVREAEALARRYRFDIVERALLLLALIEVATTVTRQVFELDAAARMKQVVERELTKASPGRADVRLLQWTRSARRARDRATALADEHGAGLVGPVQLWHAVIEDPGRRAGRALAESHQNMNTLIGKLIALAEADPQRVSYVTGSHSEP